MKDDFLTVRDIMRLLKVAQPTVNRYFRRGLIFYKIGKNVRVLRSDLDEFLARHRVKRQGDKLVRVGREKAECDSATGGRKKAKS